MADCGCEIEVTDKEQKNVLIPVSLSAGCSSGYWNHVGPI